MLIGSAEVAAGLLRVKDLRSGTQADVPLGDAVVAWCSRAGSPGGGAAAGGETAEGVLQAIEAALRSGSWVRAGGG